jgi:hypothetical protein
VIALCGSSAASVTGPWSLAGDAHRSDGNLVLTNAVSLQAGGAWRLPGFTLSGPFEAAFQFRISRPSGAGDGLALVLQSSGPKALGDVGGNLGYSGIKRSIAVEFDTWTNQAFDFGPDAIDDPLAPHISIQTAGIQPNTADPRFSLGYTTEGRLNFSDGRVHSVRIAYRQHRLAVRLDGRRRLAVTINIPRQLGLAGRCVWVGFTAATGGAFQRHEIRSFRFDAPDSKAVGCAAGPDFTG